jgi:hypothetical protein
MVAFNTNLLIIQQEMQPNGQFSLGIGDLAASLFVFEYTFRCSQMANILLGLAIWLHLFLYSNTLLDAAKWPIFFWDWQFGCISFCIRIHF